MAVVQEATSEERCAFAEVAVDSPGGRGSTFSYGIPPHLVGQIGHAVWVPFGRRRLQGIVVGLSDIPQVTETRDIHSVIYPHPVLDAARIALARWMSGYYLSPLYACLSLMLPPGLERKQETFFAAGPAENAGLSLDIQERAVLELVRRQGRVALRDMEKLAGKANSSRVTARLVRKGLLLKEEVLRPPSVKAKSVRYLRLAATKEEGTIGGPLPKGARSKAALQVLGAASSPLTTASLAETAGVSPAVISSLIKKGLVEVEERPFIRDPLIDREYPATPAPCLTSSQAEAWQAIGQNLANDKARAFLLHGVTGSGKTELYLRALESVVARGKRGIVLVPEISLTPQTIGRFSARFPGRVAVLHSRLSPGEHYDEWMRISKGEFDVVIGPRSALFAPQPDLALVVVDEEHEWSYKQQEHPPRYHARDVALKMSESMNVNVILGSATPDIVTYHAAEEGRIELLHLPDRITASGPAPLPEVSVVDMRQELKSGNRSIFSRELHRALEGVLSRRQQAILFLNRRGSSTIVMCRNCGHVMRCRRCQVSLTYHMTHLTGGDSRGVVSRETLVCHQCNNSYPVPVSCPACMSRNIRFMGTGTEKVEELLRQEFPEARTLRWDRDASAKRGSDEDIFNRFVAHDADVLIGTQMIAKGLDMPLVTLVGVVNADVNMYLPDFRSGERTFQLLCQVAGRAGRGSAGGCVVIQTYSPDHYAIKAAAKHDYSSFYSSEKSFRSSLGQPPFTRLVKLVYSHTNEMRCREEAQGLASAIIAARDEQGVAGLDLVGPVPSFVSRLRGKYRWQIVLKGAQPAMLLAGMPLKTGWTVDVDPVSVL